MNTPYELKHRRERLGLSLETVAARIPVNPSTLSRWERAETASLKGFQLTAWSLALDLLEKAAEAPQEASDGPLEEAS